MMWYRRHQRRIVILRTIHEREWRSAEIWTSAGIKRIDRNIFALILF
jgi:hypothetical protein